MSFNIWRRAVVGILFITAAAKFVGVILGAPILAKIEPSTGLQMRFIVIVMAVCEVGLIIFTMFARDACAVARAIFLFASFALAYRAIFLRPGRLGCPCLGGISHWYPWLDTYQNVTLSFLLIWLLATSAGIILFRLKS